MTRVAISREAGGIEEVVINNISPIIVSYSVVLHELMQKDSHIINYKDCSAIRTIMPKYLLYVKEINKKYKNKLYVYVPLMRASLLNWIAGKNKIQFNVFGVRVYSDDIVLFPIKQVKSINDVLDYIALLFKNGFHINKESLMTFLESFVQVIKKNRNNKLISFARNFIENRVKNDVDDNFIDKLNDIKIWEKTLIESAKNIIEKQLRHNKNKITDISKLYSMLLIVITLLFQHPNIGDFRPLDISFE